MVLGTVKFRLLVLAGLLALQFLAPALAPGTPAAALDGLGGIAEAAAHPERERPGPEQAGCDSPDPAAPNGLPRARDRYRAAADLTPQPLARPALTCTAAAERPPTADLALARPPHLGASAAQSAAVLQVYLR
ncbi:hypothetical protein [Amycolatopsis sp. 195334CR]|uniref:hypothetical protein n=1 Tax=Amycolatopsis sp. 195334CR TaxID=2814588 RepID=UPI001A8C6FA7|nr:hypothetical protein [Amycolatopsis sp. 195334CR]MBN6040307.1 hypothetical protein [Amycolatopsis sp. 195334CR]